VFGHRDASGGGYQGDCRGDVEGAQSPARAAGIQEFTVHPGGQGDAVIPHGLGYGRYLGDVRALHEQGHLKSGDLHIAQLIVIYGGDYLVGFIKG